MSCSKVFMFKKNDSSRNSVDAKKTSGECAPAYATVAKLRKVASWGAV